MTTASKKGKIVLMGSGELTATMVQVHKDLLSERAGSSQAVFLDTPAGFQLNVDQLSERVINYFHTHVQQPISIASFKSNEDIAPVEAELAFHRLRQADYILVGPGSPTYAVRQWLPSPVPEILIRRLEESRCLAAASAAALTVGPFTLPVYEIYKVGQPLYWEKGMNILGHFGLDWVVIPHWNNAEGGTHDTRFCYMGEARFQKLEKLLPEEVGILGLDEHTACIIDLAEESIEIRGLGGITLRCRGREERFEKGDIFPFEILQGKEINRNNLTKKMKAHCFTHPDQPESSAAGETSFWIKVHELEEAFHSGLKDHNHPKATNAVLKLDRVIWKAQQEREDPEFISQGRELLRELIVLMGTGLNLAPDSRPDCLVPIVESLIQFRERLRQNRQWHTADAVRKALTAGKIVIEDTKEGAKWHLAASQDSNVEYDRRKP